MTGLLFSLFVTASKGALRPGLCADALIDQIEATRLSTPTLGNPNPRRGPCLPRKGARSPSSSPAPTG